MATGEWDRHDVIATVRRIVVTWCNGPENCPLDVRVCDAHGLNPDRINPTWLPHMLLMAIEEELHVHIRMPIESTLLQVVEFVLGEPYPADEKEDLLEWSTEVEILDP